MGCINNVPTKDEAISNILEQIDKIHRIGEHIKNTKDYSKVVDINSIINEIRNQIYMTDLVDEIDQNEEYQDPYTNGSYDAYAQGFEDVGIFPIHNNTYDNVSSL